MKMINKIFSLITFAFGMLNILVSPVLADGYSPYGPYVPEDTGLADAALLVVVAVIMYTVGLGFIAVSKFLNSKVD